MAKYHHNVRPILPIRNKTHHHIFLLDALLATMIIIINVQLEGILSRLLNEQHLTVCQKYIIHVFIIFISYILCVYLLLYTFGYGLEIYD